MLAACRELARVEVTAPVEMGDVVASDLLGTGFDVVATRDMPRLDAVATRDMPRLDEAP